MHNRLSTVVSFAALTVALAAAGCGDSTTSPDSANRGDGTTGGGTSFKVTAVTVAAPNPVTFTGPCPTKVIFSGHITTDGPGKVTYVWVDSDGNVSQPNSITFDVAGTQEVVTNWTLGTNGKTIAAWELLRVTSPNGMDSSHADFTLTCAP